MKRSRQSNREEERQAQRQRQKLAAQGQTPWKRSAAYIPSKATLTGLNVFFLCKAAALPPQETYAVPDQKLLAGERPLPDKKGYVNDQVVQQHMMAKMVEAQKKAVGASANGAAHTYVPLQEQGAPPVSTQGLYEAVDDGENAAEIEIVQPPSRPADPELHGDDAVRAWLGCALTRDEAQRLLLGYVVLGVDVCMTGRSWFNATVFVFASEASFFRCRLSLLYIYR